MSEAIFRGTYDTHLDRNNGPFLLPGSRLARLSEYAPG